MAIGNLNELEILKIAKGIEEAGYDFYKSAQEKFEDEEIKNMFKYLALEELEHMKTFENIHNRVAEKLENNEIKECAYNEATTAFLRAISETAIFNVNGITLNKIENIYTVKEALYIGLQAEKDSILFYEAVLKNTKVDLTRKVLERLIKEEVKHLYKFKTLMDEMDE
ncbi:ferritin family protein [Inediibacterium massiliense]|uniref:ferritin family protein n=1 Tax=Inediibacterium massiliense TaxID=1658111 RepID=UPI0006B61442|nr:ferritin family protein [Inediibacterium massiliense]